MGLYWSVVYRPDLGESTMCANPVIGSPEGLKTAPNASIRADGEKMNALQVTVEVVLMDSEEGVYESGVDVGSNRRISGRLLRYIPKRLDQTGGGGARS